MKKYLINTKNKMAIIAGLALLLCIPATMFAQADSTFKEEGPSLISPSLDLVTVQKSDNTIDLKATIKTKIKGTFYKLSLLKITFLQTADTAEKNLGFVITNDQGKAMLTVKADDLIKSKDGTLAFKASYAGNKQMEAADAEVSIKRAWLEINPVKEDSLFTVKAKLVSTGADSSVKDVTIGIYVKRSFNPLKIGEGTTDESGEVSVEIPGGLPGDEKGNITLLAKLDENETFGNLEAGSVQKWGTPLTIKNTEQTRALWSSHPPLWMLVTFIILMGIVWGHYLVIIIQLVRLRKEEPIV